MELSGSVLLVGGSGYLGRAFLRRARSEKWDARFTVMSRDDHKLKDVLKKYPETHCIRGDVSSNPEYLSQIFRGHDTVIHMAAAKHVDMAESNVLATYETNVAGTRNVLLAAMAARVRRLIFTSTDKACSPQSTYGVTKLLGERIVAEFGSRGDVPAVSVRYGNVVSSTGSFTKILKEQYESLGYVKITDPGMTRFWMGVNDAIDLVLLAHERGNPGSVLIPFPKAMKISDVAEAACPGVEQRIIGRRNGEKTDERLLNINESLLTATYSNPQYFELFPMNSHFKSKEDPFTLSSRYPKYWLTTSEMQELIADAETV